MLSCRASTEWHLSVEIIGCAHPRQIEFKLLNCFENRLICGEAKTPCARLSVVEFTGAAYEQLQVTNQGLFLDMAQAADAADAAQV